MKRCERMTVHGRTCRRDARYNVTWREIGQQSPYSRDYCGHHARQFEIERGAHLIPLTEVRP